MNKTILRNIPQPVFLSGTLFIIASMVFSCGHGNDRKSGPAASSGKTVQATMPAAADSVKKRSPGNLPSDHLNAAPAEKQNGPREISADQLKQYILDDTVFFLIDARGDAYYRETIKGAVPIMERELEAKKRLLPKNKKTKIVAFCAGHGCGTSKKIGLKLMTFGYTNVEYYFGGLPDWKEKGYPTVVPRSQDSLKK